MEIRELAAHEYKIWDKLVEDSSNGTIFHKSFWLVACSQSLNIPLRIYGCFENERLVGGCSLYVHGWRFFRRAESGAVGMTPYGGIVLEQTRSGSVRKNEKRHRDIIECVRRGFEEEGFEYIRMVNSPTFTDIRPFTWNGWNSGIHYSYFFDLEGNVDEKISKNARRYARIARKNNVTIKKLHVPDASIYYELFTMTFERQNLDPPATANFFEEILGGLKAEGAGEMWLAETPSGEPACADIILLDSKRAYRWSAASHTDFQDTGATSLLLCEIFRDLSERGFKSIDLWAGDIPHIASFVANFNPKLLPYYSVERKAKWVRTAGYVKAFMKELFTFRNQERVYRR